MAAVLVIAVLVVVYLVSLVIHPWWNCPTCGGSEVTPGPGRSHRRCLRCEGNGRYPRLGVKILMPGTARKMRAGEKGTFY